jgi:hypothetical protein
LASEATPDERREHVAVPERVTPDASHSSRASAQFYNYVGNCVESQYAAKDKRRQSGDASREVPAAAPVVPELMDAVVGTRGTVALGETEGMKKLREHEDKALEAERLANEIKVRVCVSLVLRIRTEDERKCKTCVHFCTRVLIAW